METSARLMAACVALGVALAGCKPDDAALSVITQVDTFYQEPTNEIDVLWVIDDSRSMQEEQAAIADGFEAFISSIEQTNTDFHLGVVTTSFDTADASRGQLIGDPVEEGHSDDTASPRPDNPAVITNQADYLSLFRSGCGWARRAPTRKRAWRQPPTPSHRSCSPVPTRDFCERTPSCW
jgi:hypothetical protein